VTVAALFVGTNSELSVDDYKAYRQLEDALINGTTSSIPNIDVLVNTFFPRGASEPHCAVVNYTIVNNALTGVDDYDHAFLWTMTYLPYTTSILLLSYSKSGFSVKGFEWEQACLLKNETQLVLEIDSLDYSKDVIHTALSGLTSQVLVQNVKLCLCIYPRLKTSQPLYRG
jgi:hypothetical protein